MSNFVKTYTFVAGAKVLSAQANTNFNEIATFLNNDVVHVDASKSFSAVPSGPALDPTSGNQLARKQYVDGVLGFSTGTTPNYTLASTVKSALATMTTNVLNRLKIADVGTPLVTAKPTVASTQFTVQGGTGTVVANTVSQTVTFPTAFPNGVVSVVACIGDSTGLTAIQVSGYSKTGFTVNGFALLNGLDGVTQSFGALAGAWRYNWIAIGW